MAPQYISYQSIPRVPPNYSIPNVLDDDLQVGLNLRWRRAQAEACGLEIEVEQGDEDALAHLARWEASRAPKRPALPQRHQTLSQLLDYDDESALGIEVETEGFSPNDLVSPLESLSQLLKYDVSSSESARINSIKALTSEGSDFEESATPDETPSDLEVSLPEFASLAPSSPARQSPLSSTVVRPARSAARRRLESAWNLARQGSEAPSQTSTDAGGSTFEYESQEDVEMEGSNDGSDDSSTERRTTSKRASRPRGTLIGGPRKNAVNIIKRTVPARPTPIPKLAERTLRDHQTSDEDSSGSESEDGVEDVPDGTYAEAPNDPVFDELVSLTAIDPDWSDEDLELLRTRLNGILRELRRRNESTPFWVVMTEEVHDEDWFSVLIEGLTYEVAELLMADRPPTIEELAAIGWNADGLGVYGKLGKGRPLGLRGMRYIGKATAQPTPSGNQYGLALRKRSHMQNLTKPNTKNQNFFDNFHRANKSIPVEFSTLWRLPISFPCDNATWNTALIKTTFVEYVMTAWLHAWDPTGSLYSLGHPFWKFDKIEIGTNVRSPLREPLRLIADDRFVISAEAAHIRKLERGAKYRTTEAGMAVRTRAADKMHALEGQDLLDHRAKMSDNAAAWLARRTSEEVEENKEVKRAYGQANKDYIREMRVLREAGELTIERRVEIKNRYGKPLNIEERRL